MQRACDGCGRPYEARRSTSRFCSQRCQKRARKGYTLAPVPPLESGSVVEGPLTTHTQKTLEELGMVDTVDGQLALMLARRLDIPTTLDSGSSLAALIREHAAAVGRAVHEGKRVDDPLDEIARRRAQRRGYVSLGR